ncbi:MAG: PIG-L family deacetylase [Cyclobacteriaceae bacterium]|nr:PIG-L family deacetylase [Cyclobacteriaceae bacterium HetDA_MAG_MS6]
MLSCKSEKLEDNTSGVILAIFAHADDDAVVGPALARYARTGSEVYLVIATDGSKGVRSHANIPAGAELAAVRKKEAICSAENLGIYPPIFLELEDGSLGAGNQLSKLQYLLDSVFAATRPDIVITWDPGGYYGHIDHRMVSNVTTILSQKEKYKDISQLLFFGVPDQRQKINIVLRTQLAKDLEYHKLPTRKDLLTYQIPFNNLDASKAKAAFECYKSQFTPEEMTDLFTLNTMDSLVYFRPAFPTTDMQIKHNLFQ